MARSKRTTPKGGTKHVGFKGAVKKVEAQGESEESAERIIAAGARKASAKAKKRNPRLNKVRGE